MGMHEVPGSDRYGVGSGAESEPNEPEGQVHDSLARERWTLTCARCGWSWSVSVEDILRGDDWVRCTRCARCGADLTAPTQA